jgi:secreted PhoX family phosphatase
MRRRTLLKVGGFVAVAAVPLGFLFRRGERGAPSSALTSDPAGLLDLPPGFSYRVVDRAFQPMSDGLRVPARPDGMACFEGPGDTLILMRNHELDFQPDQGAASSLPPQAYDPRAFGGVTRVVLDRRTLDRISSNLVLAGTLRNCAGGKSPWGYLSCEESVLPGHGYVFICRTDRARVAPAERVPAYGRFNHEAAWVDPTTMIAYLTEDRADGCLYRFKPNDPARPFEGKLQALAVTGSPGLDTGVNLPAGTKHAVHWVDVPNPDPKDDSVRLQARERGAAIVRRGEGLCLDGGAVYVCATIGGRAGAGQLLRLIDGAEATLETFAESPGSDVLDMPDNIVVAPFGDVYMAEDGPGEQYIRALTPDGLIYDVARNARSRGEFTGVCFAPDGRTLFLSLQVDGVTLAVTGPFAELARAARGTPARPRS